MNERQYNSKLITDKLSYIPVPPNDMLWSKIEAQLLITHAAAENLKTPTQTSVVKTSMVKAGFIIFSSIIIIALVIWLINKYSGPKKTIPAKQAPQINAIDRKPNSSLHQLPLSRNNRQPIPTPSKQPQHPLLKDTVVIEPVVLSAEKPAGSPLIDSIPANPTPVIQVPVDTVKIKTTPLQKKEEGYYFDVQKKKGRRDKKGNKQ